MPNLEEPPSALRRNAKKKGNAPWARRCAMRRASGLPLIIIRKETKEYGMKGQIIGEFNPGNFIVLVEDVATTGGSVLKAVKTLRDAGLVVRHVVVVVDREEGAGRSLADADVELIPLVRVSELLKG